jgi:hypothetical protein
MPAIFLINSHDSGFYFSLDIIRCHVKDAVTTVNHLNNEIKHVKTSYLVIKWDDWVNNSWWKYVNRVRQRPRLAKGRRTVELCLTRTIWIGVCYTFFINIIHSAIPISLDIASFYNTVTDFKMGLTKLLLNYLPRISYRSISGDLM